MSTLSKKLLSNDDSEFWVNQQKDLDTRLTTPLTGKSDVSKLKELTERFPYGEFYMTNITTGIEYKVVYDSYQTISWYRDGAGLLFSTDRNFPRPSKIVMRTISGFKKDVTHLFN
jgi:hypothetical protein